MEPTKLSLEHVELIDAGTNQKVSLTYPALASETIWLGEDAASIDINKSYCFQCNCKIEWSELQSTFHWSPELHTANTLCDRLNDLIEDYHAPGMLRRERRSIKRKFDKLMVILQKHCAKYHINIKFTKV